VTVAMTVMVTVTVTVAATVTVVPAPGSWRTSARRNCNNPHRHRA